MKFAAKRNYYTREHVKGMRERLKKIKPKREGVTPEYLQFALGDLKAAGHMRVIGFQGMETKEEEHPSGIAVFPPFKRITNVLKFNSGHSVDINEAPHLRGYLQSASDADKHRYQIRGWFNPDGTVRIELVTNHKKETT
jgi:hypothetical protein